MQYGHRWPFWIPKNHFRSHFWPFQVNTELLIFDKIAADGHFVCPKFTFDGISGHFRSIQNLFIKFLTKWPPAAILDVRKSLSIAFLVISDRSVILDVRNSLLIAFLAISDQSAILDGRKSLTITFLAIWYGTYFYFWIFLTKWPPVGWDDNVNYRTCPRYLDEQCMRQVWRTYLTPLKVFSRWQRNNVAVAGTAAAAALTKT